MRFLRCRPLILQGQFPLSDLNYTFEKLQFFKSVISPARAGNIISEFSQENSKLNLSRHFSDKFKTPFYYFVIIFRARFRLLNKRADRSFSMYPSLCLEADKVLFRSKLNTTSYSSTMLFGKIIFLVFSV